MSNTAAIDIDPGMKTAQSPAVGSYSPPAFAFTTPEGMAPDTNYHVDSAALSAPAQDRRASDEWDASKVPPSRFQKRKGSIYSTPGSRDGLVESNYAAKFHAKHAELGYSKK